MIIDKINNYLTEKNYTLNMAIANEVGDLSKTIFQRQFMTDDQASIPGKLRLSSIGKCPRQQAYAYHGFEKNGKEIDSRAKMVFWTGDLIELTVLQLAKLAGCSIIASGQQQIKVSLKGVEGHPDALLLHEGKLYVVEVKSMSSYSFKSFQDDLQIEESYLWQIRAYMEAIGVPRCLFVALNKDSGVMHEALINYDPEFAKKFGERVALITQSTAENLPEPPKKLDFDKKTGFYPWNCLYCNVWKHCRKNAELVLVKKSYKLKEKDYDSKNLQ